MSFEDDVQIIITLRNFESDCDYLCFDDYWMQKLSEEDKVQLGEDVKSFRCNFHDNYILGRWYYIGRGKSGTVLRDNSIMFIFPLFRALKLFKTGDLITPMCFYSWKGKTREMQLHGENYASGYGLKGNSYYFKKKDIEPFKKFKSHIEDYLNFANFHNIPYHNNPKVLDSIDMRCLLALHLFLKECMGNNNYYLIYDRLINYTIGLESLYLERRDEEKRQKLSSRIAVLLSKDKSDEEKLSRDVKKFYDIRSDIVHASLTDEKGNNFLCENIYNYEDIFRKSILAFLDLNSTDPFKESILSKLDRAISSTDIKQEIQASLNLLKLAR